ncbi:MAG: tRNA (adenosine(37)-N6)-threonylcarbamoyltransferase complex dimerization subunit type 1 TsaB [Chloroflexi bacterium CFX4]|nr:tRNA (adenosine(37)-N6)-threonylcarbamoyltransferase complex dimerization subunit type 1 TsaB [Chloroflexi bacterium CFX4]MDL1923224.1 tRNA (adenosine(37)-N6)-threonylcarbamoyltransferase complex dimerization subunit type 1 TsaB [Chloroflexi bacterium CFX3]
MLLAIDTATRALSLALHDGSDVYAEYTWQTESRHTVELVPAIHNVLRQVRLTPQDLTHLAVAQGPGSFNGLRVGFSVAQSFAFSLNVPLIAVPTLDITAAAQPPLTEDLIAFAQAGRGRLCAAAYRWQADQGWQVQGETRIDSPAALFAAFSAPHTPTRLAGEVDNTVREAVHQLNTEADRQLHLTAPALALRRATFLAELAWARFRSGERGDPLRAVPFYLHQPGVPHP